MSLYRGALLAHPRRRLFNLIDKSACIAQPESASRYLFNSAWLIVFQLISGNLQAQTCAVSAPWSEQPLDHGGLQSPWGDANPMSVVQRKRTAVNLGGKTAPAAKPKVIPVQDRPHFRMF